ncbi:MAG: DUF1464 family protein [Promethearchaeota archaeon]
MVKAIGIDPGTHSWSFFGFKSNKIFLDLCIPTYNSERVQDAIKQTINLVDSNTLVSGPSGYGTPLCRLADASAHDFYLLSLTQESNKIGLRWSLRELSCVGESVYLLPGVKHLPSVPIHRKYNHIDMGTADKVCAAAWALNYYSSQKNITYEEVNAIIIELGYGFNAFMGIEQGKIVDGIGGSNSTLGFKSGGALDAEVAYLLGKISKKTVFSGGVAHENQSQIEDLEHTGLMAYVEAVLKDIARIRVSLRECDVILISGRFTSSNLLVKLLQEKIDARVLRVDNWANYASHAAQGAALIANGLLNGEYKSLIDVLEIKKSTGSILDKILYDIPMGK